VPLFTCAAPLRLDRSGVDVDGDLPAAVVADGFTGPLRPPLLNGRAFGIGIAKDKSSVGLHADADAMPINRNLLVVVAV
jgi:hypothetical protein